MSMVDIRKAVEEFKKENGNETFQTKDLVIYLVKRMDNLPCGAHVSRIAGLEARIKTWTWISGILITLFLIIISLSMAVRGL